jgi:hypothetical protein
MSSIYDPASEDFLHDVFDFEAASGEASTQHFDSAFEDFLRDNGPLHNTVLDGFDIEGAEPLEQMEDHSMVDTTTVYDMNSNAAGRFASTQLLGSVFQDDNVGADGKWRPQSPRVPEGSSSFPATNNTDFRGCGSRGYQSARAPGLIGADTELSHQVPCRHQISEPMG